MLRIYISKYMLKYEDMNDLNIEPKKNINELAIENLNKTNRVILNFIVDAEKNICNICPEISDQYYFRKTLAMLSSQRLRFESAVELLKNNKVETVIILERVIHESTIKILYMCMNDKNQIKLDKKSLIDYIKANNNFHKSQVKASSKGLIDKVDISSHDKTPSLIRELKVKLGKLWIGDNDVTGSSKAKEAEYIGHYDSIDIHEDFKVFKKPFNQMSLISIINYLEQQDDLKIPHMLRHGMRYAYASSFIHSDTIILGKEIRYKEYSTQQEFSRMYRSLLEDMVHPLSIISLKYKLDTLFQEDFLSTNWSEWYNIFEATDK